VDARQIDAASVAQRLIQLHLAVKPGEQVLLVADPETELAMAYALAAAVQAAGAEYTLALMPSRTAQRATELTPIIERGLEAADVLIGLTRTAGAPTYARKVTELLAARRLRSLSMVMRSLDNWTKGAATADYEALERLGWHLAAIWGRGERVEITSPSGTHLIAGVGKRPVMGQVVIVECGLAREPGREAAFSDGEISQRPATASAHGRLVVDGPIALIGGGDDPVTLEVEAGKVVQVEGGRRARRLQQILEEVPGADHIAEIGLGLNLNALRNDDFEEEKKAAGNVHVALGSDLFYGGDHACAVHLDMVIRSATFRVDGEPLCVEGRLQAGAAGALGGPAGGRGGGGRGG